MDSKHACRLLGDSRTGAAERYFHCYWTKRNAEGEAVPISGYFVYAYIRVRLCSPLTGYGNSCTMMRLYRLYSELVQDLTRGCQCGVERKMAGRGKM